MKKIRRLETLYRKIVEHGKRVEKPVSYKKKVGGLIEVEYYEMVDALISIGKKKAARPNRVITEMIKTARRKSLRILRMLTEKFSS